VKKPNVISDCNNFKERKNDMDTLIGKTDNLYGITTVNGGNMSDYFIKKKHKNVDDAPAKNHVDTQKEQLAPEYGVNECEAKIKTKKKQKHKNTESPTIWKKEADEQETKNELSLSIESIDGVNAKKKKRKLEEGTKEEYLLKEDEKNYEEIYIKQYSKEDECNFVQEIQTRRKHKVSPNINEKEVQQETGGDVMNDSGSFLHYKRKKRKLEKERKEHLIVEEETVKQDERTSVMESCNEKGMYRCELEDNKTKRKKKLKEKDADCPDAQEKEVEAERNDNTVVIDNIITSSTYKKSKRKSKQEVKGRMEDEITEQGKRIDDDSNSSVPSISCKCEVICEKCSLHENDESVNDQDIAPTGDKSVHKDNSSRKLKNHTFIDRSTEEVDHREMKDHKPMEEENVKHKVKKKKRKCSNDGNIHDIQEHKHIQHNLKDTPTDSCNSEKCEELSVTGETSASVNCKNDEEKEKRKNRKRLNKIYTGVECKKDEILQELQEQVDTETNQHDLNTATQNDIQNVECSMQASSKHKQKQGICNSDVCNSDCANIKIDDIVNRDLNIRNMKPSTFAKLVDPSLIRFRGSNLCKIPGYGCY
jgi:hypothetical protein